MPLSCADAEGGTGPPVPTLLPPCWFQGGPTSPSLAISCTEQALNGQNYLKNPIPIRVLIWQDKRTLFPPLVKNIAPQF